ncbi:MAG: S41 family peptidase [Planctomycetota bacterium]|jgi:carboxyl-terminal processing protease
MKERFKKQLVIVFICLASVSGAVTSEVPSELNEEFKHARQLLTGPEKDLVNAQQELIKLIKEHAAEITPYELCMSYIYLGYIGDNQGDRQRAVRWYEKASMVGDDKIKHARSLARRGMRESVTWIRHLDQGQPKIPSKYKPKTGSTLENSGNGIVYKELPSDRGLQTKLSPEEMEENFEILVQAVDQHYSFFVHKDIDWEVICKDYRKKLKYARTSRDFYRLVYQFVRRLEDSHSRLENYKATSEIPPYAPPISFRRIGNKPVVVDVWKQSRAYREGVRPGWILRRINDKTAGQHLRLLQNRISVSSSQRNLEEKATRMILCGKRDSWIELDFLTTEQRPARGFKMARSVRYPETEPEPPLNLKKLKAIRYGRHSSGVGYIRIVTFKGRMEIADEFDRALDSLRNTKSLIIDIRDNTGGYGTCQKRIIGRFLSEKAPGIISYRRNGSGHNDFEITPEYISPCGKWQYEKPVAVLMNAMTGSAGDLFAARLISSGRVVSMRQTTHGNLPGVGVYALLPCNLIVRISYGYIADANGRIIEGNGNEPEIILEPTIQDASKYVDGVLERAFEKLNRITPANTTSPL